MPIDEINVDESLLTTKHDTTQPVWRVQNLAGEKGIHVAIFLLVLVGLGGISGWIINTYAAGNVLLAIAGIALCWGVILLALYACFGALGWKWWE